MWYTERNGKKKFCGRKLVEVVCTKIKSRASYIIVGS